MPRETINVTPGGERDTWLGAFARVNRMFAEIYAVFGDGVILAPPEAAALASIAPLPLASAAETGVATVAARADHRHAFPVPTDLGVVSARDAVGAGLVLAGPASGPSTAPVFRGLVKADIPSLDTDLIKEGVLPTARGGSGVSAAPPNQFFAGPVSGGSSASPAFRVLAADDLPVMVGAGTLAGGAPGAVPSPSAGDPLRTLCADGGWRRQAGSGTVASVDIDSPNAGLAVGGGPVTGVGVFSIALADDMAAIEALTGTGIARRTGTDAWSLGQVSLATEVDGNLPVTCLDGGIGATNKSFWRGDGVWGETVALSDVPAEPLAETATVGTAGAAARADHQHPLPVVLMGAAHRTYFLAGCV